MKVKIYQPTKSAMQSGKANVKHWLLEPFPESERFIEPVMGWTGSADMTQELRMKFATREQAVAFAERSGYEYVVLEPKKPQLKLKSYADNFK